MDLAPILTYLFLTFLFSFFISSLLLSRMSIKHINIQMEKDGVYPPSWDRGIGASASFYVFAMLFSKYRIKNTLFDARFVAKHARPIDRVIAAVHFISVTGMIICLCIITLFKSFY
ncbi:MAG TPA: hypothetical protein ENH88_09105 [Pseudoalteromonas prydzensis]|uniref:Uncharacterized protein n=1 Tax=Pseudoalteromonas prydzensis TaxID=182141 RepID=A0A7V1GEC0_9GAMM|nr:hypothetical protein [Pseudoalteromonas prydzensis]HEA16583.1 hypothetical protein [Pseudoalteromonas prydzensis]